MRSLLMLLLILGLEIKSVLAQEALKKVTTTDLIFFIIENEIDKAPSWLIGLKLTPSLRYEVAGLRTTESGVRSQTGGDYTINLSATYDFREERDELRRINKDKSTLIQEIVGNLQKLQTFRVQFKFIENNLATERNKLKIMEKRVEQGLSSRQDFWEKEADIRKQELERLKVETDYKAMRFEISVMVYQKREALLEMIDQWEGF